MPHQSADETIPNNASTQRDWTKFDATLKRYIVAGVIGCSLVIALLFGPQALYLVIGIGAVGAFAIYPEIDPEWVLWGSTIGALCAGPLAIIPGGLLGYYVGQKYNQFLNKMEALNSAVDSVKSGIETVKSAPSNIKSKFKNIWGSIGSYFDRTKTAAPDEEKPAITLSPQTEAQQEVLPEIVRRKIVETYPETRSEIIPQANTQAPLRRTGTKQIPILVRKANEDKPHTNRRSISSTPKPLLFSDISPQKKPTKSRCTSARVLSNRLSVN